MSKSPYSLDFKKEVVSRIKDGETRVSLVQELGLSPATITKWVREEKEGTLGIEKKREVRKNISEEQKMAAVKDLVSGVPLKEVEKNHSITNSTLYKFMKEKGIEYRSGHGRKHSFNQDYFSRVTDSKVAYWLGFIMADGSVHKVSKLDKQPVRLTINISKRDRCLLEWFCDDIGLSRECIVDYMPTKETYGNNPMTKVMVNSKKICEDLKKYNIVERKSTFKVFPNNIPNEYIHHYIRGYFDGDGGAGNQHFQVTSNKEFLLSIQKIIMKELDFSKTKLIPYRNKNVDICDLKYGGRQQMHKLEAWLYKDAIRYLPRKQDKFYD